MNWGDELPQGEVVVHEQPVPAHRAHVAVFRHHVAALQEVREPAAGLGAQQLVGADRVRVVLQRREGALGRHAQRLDHGGNARRALRSGAFRHAAFHEKIRYSEAAPCSGALQVDAHLSARRVGGAESYLFIHTFTCVSG
ncbi:hypothetical protein EYF80_041811 [Liparis tanakae]|uniref:Uncharacterized protein n=1 Tax=Liparis tanakae TaxID=230148 RepID=A0A4Z2G377_9TELE|nr:hypothetical protein EYF80_041811 [Liparis tanakae]